MRQFGKHLSIVNTCIYIVLICMGVYISYTFIRGVIITYGIYTLQSRMREHIYPGAIIDKMPNDLRSRIRLLPNNQYLQHIKSLMNVEEEIYALEKGHMMYYFTIEQTSNTQVLKTVHEIRS